MQWTSLNFSVETDCAEAASLIREGTPNTSVYAFRIDVIREFLMERDISVVQVSRDINSVSHILAKLGRVQGRTEFWLSDYPQEVASAVSCDCTSCVN
jgi:hypothetical protein